jgi:hypothetical protein
LFIFDGLNGISLPKMYFPGGIKMNDIKDFLETLAYLFAIVLAIKEISSWKKRK